MNPRIPELDCQSEARVRSIQALPTGAHVHLTGVCGTGMAPLAVLLKELGFRISGSDVAFYAPMGDLVRKVADHVYESYTAANFEATPDLVVIGNSIRKTNPEFLEVQERGIPFASLPEMLRALLIGERDHCRWSVVIAGTHGKTTTSAACATILEEAGFRPGFFIGGLPLNFNAGIRLPSTDLPPDKRVVVLEGDEYDSACFAKWPKFHSYRPDIAVITSYEFDHADIYSSLEEIGLEFLRFVSRVPPDGIILVGDHDSGLVELTKSWLKSSALAAPVRFFGVSDDAHYRLVSRRPLSDSNFQEMVFRLGEHDVTARSPLIGEHNAMNLLAAASVAHWLGSAPEAIVNGIESFRGVRRRQQLFQNPKGSVLIEDFAHHPTAVRRTLAGVRERYSGRRILAAFEARSNTSRRAFFQQQYAESFSDADLVFVRDHSETEVYSNVESGVGLLDLKRLASDIERKGSKVYLDCDIGNLANAIEMAAKDGDVIVVMSNGDFGGLLGKVQSALSFKASPPDQGRP